MGMTRYRGDMPDPKKIGIEAAERSSAAHGAKKGESEVMDLVVETGNRSRRSGPLIEAHRALSALQQKRIDLLEGRLGTRRIASEKLTLDRRSVHSARGLGSRLFDGEGLCRERG